jgi:hypothetical protein
MIYYRLEVWVNGRWWGYWKGCYRLRELGVIGAAPGCCMGAPPFTIFETYANQKRKRLRAWATKAGWRQIRWNVKDAIDLCEYAKVPWRILRAEDPGKIIYEDMSQAIVEPRHCSYRTLRKGNCEKGQDRIPPWLVRKPAKKKGLDKRAATC